MIKTEPNVLILIFIEISQLALFATKKIDLVLSRTFIGKGQMSLNFYTVFKCGELLYSKIIYLLYGFDLH
jgi:hypothetical protein